MPYILKMATHSPSFGELTVQRSSAVVNAGLRAVSVNGQLLVSLLRVMAGWLEGRNAQRFVETNEGFGNRPVRAGHSSNIQREIVPRAACGVLTRCAERLA